MAKEWRNENSGKSLPLLLEGFMMASQVSSLNLFDKFLERMEYPQHELLEWFLDKSLEIF